MVLCVLFIKLQTLIPEHLFPPGVGPAHIAAHKSQTQKVEACGRGMSGEEEEGGRAVPRGARGAHSNKSCLVLIKGPQRSPAVTNRVREARAEDPRRAEFMLSLVGFIFKRSPCKSAARL